nr:MAG TPA: hypothetical protein [Bacteriophage sp.]
MGLYLISYKQYIFLAFLQCRAQGMKEALIHQ